MATSVVAICNQALYLLGEEAITSLDDGTKAATLCSLLWPEVRDAVLADHPWNSALVRVELSQDATAPVYEYSYRYVLPTDPYCLRVVSTDLDIYLDRNGEPAYPWKIEGRYLLTNAIAIFVLYIARITDVTQYTHQLSRAMAAKLASELAFPITRNPGIVQGLEEMYLQKLSDAKAIDAQESSPDVFESNVLWNARLAQ